MRGRTTCALLLSQVASACFTLDGIFVGEPRRPTTWLTESIRGGGDIWQPADHGCNQLPCGTFLNDETYDAVRVQVPADELGLKIKSHLRKVWDGGQMIAQLKYGHSPNFAVTPGFELGSVNVPADADVQHVYQTAVMSPAYNYNATIQIAYHTDGLVRATIPGNEAPDHTSVSFYQCIDIEVVGGMTWPNGTEEIGPFEKAELDDEFGVQPPVVVPKVPVNTFLVVAVVFAVLLLIGLIIAAVLYVLLCKSEEKPKEEPVVREQVIVKAEAPVEEPIQAPKPVSVSPEQPQEEEEEVVTEFNYREETPPAAKPIEAAGSEGRHFHFRYISEEEGKL